MVVDFKWTLHEEGLIADIPTAGTDGRLYYATDEDILYYDNGASWTAFDLAATHILLSILTGATYDDVQDFVNQFGQRTDISGFAITDNEDGTVAVAAGTGWCKVESDINAEGKFFDYAGGNSPALGTGEVSYIYLDYNEGSPAIVKDTDFAYALLYDHIILGCVWWDGVAAHIFEAEQVGLDTAHKSTLRAFELRGNERASGAVTTGVGTRQLDITAGVFWLGSCRKLSPAFNTITGSTFSYWWTADSGTSWTEVTAQTAIDNTQYNDITSGLVGLSAASHRGVHWLYLDHECSHLHIVYGQDSYSLAEAELAPVPSVLPPMVSNFGILIAKIIVQKDQSTLTFRYPWITVFASSLAADHGNLAGLGDDDHTQYVLDSLFDAAHTIIKADVQSTPEGLTVAEQRLVGRITDGVITALTGAQVMALLSGQAGAAFDWNSQELTGIDRRNYNETNLLENGDFEVGDPPTGWSAGNSAILAQEGGAGLHPIGAYSIKVTVAGGQTNAWAFQDLADPTRYQGRTITIGAWVYVPSTISAGAWVRIALRDDRGNFSSAIVPHDDAWHWITRTVTIDAVVTYVGGTVGYIAAGAPGDYAYTDGAILVEGDSCPAFSPKPMSVYNGTLVSPTINGTISTTGLTMPEVTFNAFPITPSAPPDANYEVANKKYVDDEVAGGTTSAEALAFALMC